MRKQLQRSLIRSHAAGSGPEVEREVVRAMMLLRLSTLASGRTGVRRETAQAYADLLSAGLTPVVYEYGSLGCSGDLAPLAHVALAVMGEGQVRTARRRTAGDGRRAARARPGAGHLLREGGPGAHQRHRRHARPTGARTDRSGQPVPAGRYRRGDECRGTTRHRPGVRRRSATAAAAPRPGRGGREHDAAARGFGDRRQSPGSGLRRRAGRLLAAVFAPGGRRRTGHRGARPRRRRARTGQRHRQSRRHARRPGGVQRQLPRCAGGLRARLPGHRRRRSGRHQRTPHRPVPRRGAQPRAATRSWRTIPASTAAT